MAKTRITGCRILGEVNYRMHDAMDEASTSQYRLGGPARL